MAKQYLRPKRVLPCPLLCYCVVKLCTLLLYLYFVNQCTTLTSSGCSRSSSSSSNNNSNAIECLNTAKSGIEFKPTSKSNGIQYIRIATETCILTENLEQIYLLEINTNTHVLGTHTSTCKNEHWYTCPVLNSWRIYTLVSITRRLAHKHIHLYIYTSTHIHKHRPYNRPHEESDGEITKMNKQ